MKKILTSGYADYNRRRYARFFFDAPLEATLGGVRVRVLDFGRTGAGIEHHEPLPNGRTAVLDLVAEGVRVRVPARVVRCRLARRAASGSLEYRSGIRFGQEGGGAVLAALERLVSAHRQELRFVPVHAGTNQA